MRIYLLSSILLIPQLLIDILTLCLTLRRNRQGKGASGFSIISLFFSSIGIFSPSISISFCHKFTLLASAIFLHWVLVSLIPSVDRKQFFFCN